MEKKIENQKEEKNLDLVFDPSKLSKADMRRLTKVQKHVEAAAKKEAESKDDQKVISVDWKKIGGLAKKVGIGIGTGLAVVGGAVLVMSGRKNADANAETDDVMDEIESLNEDYSNLSSGEAAEEIV